MSAPGEPAEPGRQVPGVGAAGPRGPQSGQPRRHQELLPLAQVADHGELRPYPAGQLGRQPPPGLDRNTGSRSRSPGMAGW